MSCLAGLALLGVQVVRQREVLNAAPLPSPSATYWHVKLDETQTTLSRFVCS